jgi:hypothetical protein
MNKEEKLHFLSMIKYFHEERGDIERYTDFSFEKLRNVDSELFYIYSIYKVFEEKFEKYMESLEYET